MKEGGQKERGKEGEENPWRERLREPHLPQPHLHLALSAPPSSLARHPDPLSNPTELWASAFPLQAGVFQKENKESRMPKHTGVFTGTDS